MSIHLNARRLLDQLVSFPTVSCESNLDLITFVADYLRSLGVEPTIAADTTGQKAALYAHIGPKVDGAVLLSGHTDVVPVTGQAWDADPFTVTEKNGRLYGRGTCDMKGFLAIALAAVPLALARGVKRPLQIALSYDEEIGCLGAPKMLDHMAQSGLPKAGLAIIGEPSMMKTVTGHKGTLGFDITVTGHEVHSSLMHTGVSAIMEAAKIITWANDRNAKRAGQVPADIATQFDPPWTTTHVGLINGGTANNITAKTCTFSLDFRCVPGEDMQDHRAELMSLIDAQRKAMQAVHPDADVAVHEFFNVPPCQPETGGAAEAFVRQLTGDNATHVVSFATEAGQFQNAGFSSVIWGPGDIAQAHQPNEFMITDQFAKGCDFMTDLVDSLAQG